MYRVFYGGDLLHDPRTDSALLGDLQLEQNQNECGYCEFTIYPDHPLHGTLKERDMANQIKVYDDEALLFQGFIYELGKDFQTSGTVKCKGDLALLECSIVRPYSTLEGVYETTVPNSVDGYFKWLIEQHNEQVEQEKRFAIGMNEGNLLDKNNYIYRESKQLPTTAEEIEGKILDELGGYIRVRYPNGVRTIDLMAECYDANTQIFDVGVNLMDYQETTDALEMYTALVLQGATPEGYDLPLTVESLEDGIYAKDAGFSKLGDLVYSHSAVERYGWIVGTYENQDITTAEGLLDAGVMALKSCISPIKTIEVKAVDLSIINKDYKAVQVGEYVRVRSRVHGFDSYMLCTSIAPDLNNPENSLYTLGMTFDSLTGIQNKRINALNATITKNYERTEAISAEAKSAANQAAMANATAEQAQAQAEAAQTAADGALEKAESASAAASEATTAANDAKTAADEAAQAASEAQEKADAAQAKADSVEGSVTAIQTDVAEAQAAAEAAQQKADEADSKAVEAQTAASNAQTDASAALTAAQAAQTTANSATDKANAAQTSADEAKTAAADASTTAAAAKLDAEQAQKDIDALGEELETVSNTMTADYARKTDLTEATASLQTQITQNAAGIESNASKIVTIDETANDAAEKAEAAQTAASAAQTAADQATADATAAQTAADEAAAAAAAAQTNADTANAAAAAAQTKADEAAADLATAKQNLADVTSRVDSTEEEIAAAQQAVTDAQSAADKAQADATAAATKAATAQTTADNAATAASTAQTAADDAAAKAATAQETADKAQGDATAAKAAADQAAADAAAAQETANTAKANAATAQSAADQAAATAAAAQQAADDADAKAAQAAADLATAEQNLADVTSRVDATESEIAEAKAAVDEAAANAASAAADATAAQQAADAAKTDAAAAQTAADQAVADAAAAQTAADQAKEAADAAQADVDALAVRVTTAETKITQNAEAIELRATKTEVTETLGGYYTKEEADAAIKVSADNITSSVSSTYATKTALASTDTKASNAATAASNAQDAAEAAQSTADTAKANAATAQSTADTASSTANTAKTNAAAAKTAADAAQADVDNLEVGGRNLLGETNFLCERDNTATDTLQNTVKMHPSHCVDIAGKTITLSVYIHSTGTRDTSLSTNTTMNDRFGVHGYINWTDSTGVNTNVKTIYPFMDLLSQTVENDRISSTYTVVAPDGYDTVSDAGVSVQQYAKPTSNNSEMWLLGYPKLEYGNKATDWTPAPEDVDQSIADTRDELHESISSLQVTTDGINASVQELRVNTEEALAATSSEIATLTEKVSVAMTAEQVQIQIQSELSDGVSKVSTSTGVTVDENGLTVDKSDSEMATTISDDGMKVKHNDETVLTANSAGVDAKNLHATTYLIVGENSRFEDYEENDLPRTGCFWIGATSI